MKIQVLGSGCQTCKNLHDLVSKAAAELAIADTVEYVTGDAGTKKIIEMGVMQSPVLAIDGKPVMTGYIPDIDAVKDIIRKHRS